MALLSIGQDHVQVAYARTRRHAISVQMLPISIASGNTGKVYGKFGAPPVASDTSNSWDFVLEAGAGDGDNLYEARDVAVDQRDLWLVASADAQQVSVVERIMPPPEPAPAA